MTYPGAIDSYSTKTDGVDDVMAADVNDLQDAVTAIETELGTDPAGSLTDLKARLGVALTDAGLLRLTPGSTLTISGGTINPTGNYYLVDTEGAAASDNLDTITAGVSGQILILQSVSHSRIITIRNNAGNIYGGAVMNYGSDYTILIYNSNLSKWCCQGYISTASDNIWTGANTFNGAFAVLIGSVNADVTLDATYHVVTADASSAAFTITLPAASSCPGREYSIKKIDDSANHVTIAGDGADTIDGASTKVLSAQWAGCTIISTGSQWIIKL